MSDVGALFDIAEEYRFVKEVLNIFWQADAHSDLFWRVDDGKLRLFANCSDFFYWATADLEEILPEDLDMLKDCYEKLRAIKPHYAESIWMANLFVARKRKLRPMPEVKFKETPDVKPLFDACGPPR